MTRRFPDRRKARGAWSLGQVVIAMPLLAGVLLLAAHASVSARRCAGREAEQARRARLRQRLGARMEADAARASAALLGRDGSVTFRFPSGAAASYVLRGRRLERREAGGTDVLARGLASCRFALEEGGRFLRVSVTGPGRAGCPADAFALRLLVGGGP